MRGARPPRSDIGVLVPNKHQLLLPQTFWAHAASSCGGLEEESQLFSLGFLPLTLYRPKYLETLASCPHQREHTLTTSPSIYNFLGAPAPQIKGGKEK